VLTLTFILFFLLCAILGMPILFAFGLAAGVACLMGDLPLQIIAQRMMIGMDSFALLAVPGFILCGEIMCHGGISQRLVDFSNSLVGHLRGGLAMVTVLTGMIMGGISGSAVADTAAVASVLVPSMEKQGYPRQFSAAVVGTAGPLGNIIPPSIPMVIYSMTSGLSLLDLFLAGYAPGVMIGVALMTYCYLAAKKHAYGSQSAGFRLTLVFSTFLRSILAIFMPLIIVGGILSGVFTPTESAMVGVVYSLAVALILYREMGLADLPKILLSSALSTAKLVVIMAAASVFSYISIMEGIPEIFKDFMLGLSDNPYVILIILNAFLLLLGCIIDILVATIVLVPVLIPLGAALGIDPLHLAMIFVINMSIGLLTPPVGYSLFVASTVAQVPVEQVARAAIPVVVTMLLILALINLFPALSLTVPRLIR
jgi:tripartite ATP-independent transporter DctM subunit